MVRTQLLRQKQTERFQVYIAKIKSDYNLTITLPYPEVPRADISADDDPFLGPENAPVTIIQFAEFQCPYCGRGNQVMEEVRKAYGDKVKIVYRDFPLDFHDRAIPAAVAANCAAKQDKFWEIHAILMSNQQKLQDEDLLSAAKQVGVADIAADHVHTRRVFFHGCLRGVEALLVSSVQDHGCATLGTGDGNGFADASAGPRDDNDVVREVWAKVG